MRRPSIYNAPRGPLEVKMTPMIDVVFLLLVFFVWSASFHVVEYTLPSRLSAETGTAPTDANDPPPPEADFDNVVVRIFWTGQNATWQINDQPLTSLQQVADQLKAIAQIKPDAPVIIHPDPLVPLGDVMDVFDKSRLANFETVQFAAVEGT